MDSRLEIIIEKSGVAKIKKGKTFINMGAITDEYINELLKEAYESGKEASITYVFPGKKLKEKTEKTENEKQKFNENENLIKDIINEISFIFPNGQNGLSEEKLKEIIRKMGF